MGKEQEITKMLTVTVAYCNKRQAEEKPCCDYICETCAIDALYNAGYRPADEVSRKTANEVLNIVGEMYIGDTQIKQLAWFKKMQAMYEVKMDKEITVQDCLELQEKFNEYCSTAEQHEFSFLALIQLMMDKTIAEIKAANKVENQKNIKAMFRVVLGAIGQDYSAYEEGEE